MNAVFNLRLARGRIGARITSLFFDRELVQRAVDRKTAAALSRFGYFTMRDARQSIRSPRRVRLADLSPEAKRRHKIAANLARGEGRPQPPLPLAASKPGQPPRDQTGLLKRFVYFVYDPSRRSVAVGPALLAGSRSSPPVTEVLEYGGRSRNSRSGKLVQIDARPYMRPAFDKQLNKQVARLWAAGISTVRN